MRSDYYTYAYLRDDGTPYYIGKGRGWRAYARKRAIKRPEDRSKILILKKNLTEEEAFRHEVYMIAVFGRRDLGTGTLYNFTDGGEGSSGCRRGSPTEETRRKMSAALSGRGPLSEEHRKKISLAKTGKPGGMTGKTQSPETRRKMSEAHLRRHRSTR